MKVLLDTNIIIHRENIRATNHAIGLLFYWLDKLHCEKCVHPYSLDELRKFQNANMQELYDAKLSAYTELKTVAPQKPDFIDQLPEPKSENDRIDHQLLCEVYSNRVDLLISEDKGLRTKAKRLGIGNQVLSINEFVSKNTMEHPDLISYKMLAVKKEFFGNVDLDDPFFDTFKEAYPGFEAWFNNNARKRNVDEIYVTLFEDRPELKILEQLFEIWGFVKFGTKTSHGKEEVVYVKDMISYNPSQSVKMNYPNMLYDRQKFILPILPKYHTSLLPDSKLNTENEVDFIENLAHSYALEKVYITWTPEGNVNPGDLLLFYRMGEEGSNKKYSSVVTSLGMVESVHSNFKTKDEYLKLCENRSVFSRNELDDFWNHHRYNLKVLKFVYVTNLLKRPTLDFLYNCNVVQPPRGPRPFTRISDAQFDAILKESQTIVKFYQE